MGDDPAAGTGETVPRATLLGWFTHPSSGDRFAILLPDVDEHNTGTWWLRYPWKITWEDGQ